MTEPSETYKAALARTISYHEAKGGKTFSGAFMFKKRHEIKDLIDRFGVASMLDYGCGAGKQYRTRIGPDQKAVAPGEPGYARAQSLEQYFGFETFKYDPAVRKYMTEPTGSFDMVCAIQIMNCIPINDLPWVVNRLYSFATKVVYVAERLGPSKKKIHEDMGAAMPINWSAEKWLSVLQKAPDDLITLPKMIVDLHSVDQANGWLGWKQFE